MLSERSGGIAVFAVVVAAVAFGFTTIGPPQHVRAIELDHRRVSDLQSIERRVHLAESRRRSATETVAAPVRPRNDWPRDPETGQPYGYQRLSPTVYVLCATFGLPSDADGTNPAIVRWWHRAGRTCYRLDANAVDDEPEAITRLQEVESALLADY